MAFEARAKEGLPSKLGDFYRLRHTVQQYHLEFSSALLTTWAPFTVMTGSRSLVE